jgi:hypothetical protein
MRRHILYLLKSAALLGVVSVICLALNRPDMALMALIGTLPIFVFIAMALRERGDQ